MNNKIIIKIDNINMDMYKAVLNLYNSLQCINDYVSIEYKDNYTIDININDKTYTFNQVMINQYIKIFQSIIDIHIEDNNDTITIK